MASIAVSLSSCQKEFNPGIDLGNDAKLGTGNKAKLSAALRVWHGTRTLGTPPAPNAQSPAIDPSANPSIKAIAGRLAIIKPEVTAGNIAGYYVAVPGSGQYFKLDFSKPRDIAGKGGLPGKRNDILSRRGNEDSSIVIVLPANINAPDTFCVTYYPYDSLGNIGQPVTTCIYVATLGANGNNGWLYNDFKLTSTWEDSAGIRVGLDTIIFNRWFADDYFNEAYHCYNGFLEYGVLPTGAVALANDSLIITKSNLRFALNGAFDYSLSEKDKIVNHLTSSCSQIIFSSGTYDDVMTGGFSYDDASRKLVLIYELDDNGIPSVEYYEGTVTKINNNHFILRDIDGYHIRFQR